MNTAAVAEPGRQAAPETHPRRLLGGLAPDGAAVSLPSHRAAYPAPPTVGSKSWPQLIQLVERAGLVGRGGAGFPTGRKLRSVAAWSRRPVVVANGTEGEPNSAKDRLLLKALPHLVLDGALWAAAATGAERVVVAIDRDNVEGLEAMRRALAERAREEPPSVVVEITDAPPRFVAGESSALVHWLNGGPAKPPAAASRTHQPRPHEQGVDGRPTLVQNVETLAHLAQICTWGSEWFRLVGPPEEPGTGLFTVSGAVARPSVLEAPIGTSISEIVALAGGPTSPLQAFLVGGFFGTWIPAGLGLHTPYSRAGLEPLGASPGSGCLIALAADACGLVETARMLSWYAAESAGQCGPCVFGLADLATGSASVASGAGRPGDVAQLRRWADQIDGRGGCHHPDGAVQLLRSALNVFAADVDRHLAGLACAGAGARPRVYVPRPSSAWR